MITTWFYDSQIRGFMVQFAAIFQGLQVRTGQSGRTTDEQIAGVDKSVLINVPIHMGSKDRVVAAVTSGNTINASFSLPIMSCDMQAIELAPERRKGVGLVDRRVTMPSGGVYPDDLVVVRRLMPIPYNLTMELSIYASNTQQMHQILEQILLLFDPLVQIQKTDANFDWTKLTTVELMSIQNETNYPSGTDRRMIMWTLSFNMPIWLSAPADMKKEIVKDIYIRFGNLDAENFKEVDEEGNLTLFLDDSYGTTHVGESDLMGPLQDEE